MGKYLVKISFLSVLFAFYSAHATPNLEDSSQLDSGLVQAKYGETLQKLSVSPDFGQIPLYFIPNEGQVDEKALFYAKTSRYTLWMTREGLVFDSSQKLESDVKRYEGKGELGKWEGLHRDTQPESYERDVSRLIFLNAKENPEIVPLELTEHRVNYFKGNDKSEWKADIPTSKRVLYKDLYKNIDLKVYGMEKQIEYDWIVKPGGNPEEIIFTYKDTNGTEINNEGDLSVLTEFGELIHKRPVSYQVIGGDRIDVESSFKRLGNDAYGFEVGAYDKNFELVLDPVVLVYSTYLGGIGFDDGCGIAVDSSGNAYVIGYTWWTDFPTQNPYQTNQGGDDVFVTKLSPTGNSLTYSTYLGGSADDYGFGIAVDSSGNAYVIGYTDSADFPTQNPYQTDQGDRDVFITKLSSAGNSLTYSTYLGGTGSDDGRGIAVDSSGNAYVTGQTYSTDFPTQNPYQTDQSGCDVFVTKFSSVGNSLIYSTYLGGSGGDWGHGISVDSSGNAYVTGDTYSTDFPTQNPYQTDQGGTDVFITKLSPSGNSLTYSTYLSGGSEDYGRGIAVDSSGNAYVIGSTSSTDFPTQNPYQTDQGVRDVFVTKLTPAGNSLAYSTYLGGGAIEWGLGIAVDSSGNAYVTGWTDSTDFPTQNPYQTDQGNYDAFVTKLSSAGSSLSYSTYLGGYSDDSGHGIAVDSSGNAYVTGWTGSPNFPTQNPYQTEGGVDAFVTKLTLIEPDTFSVTPGEGFSSSGQIGGPFIPSSLDYLLINTCDESIDWTAAKTQTWIDLSVTGGTLGAGESTIVTVSINSTANGLAVGIYGDTVSFTNTTNGLGNTTRDVSLTVICPSPTIPTNPDPTNGATGVLNTADLDWDDSTGADSYDVYFGTSSSPPFVATTTSSYWNPPGNLAYNTHYYWRIYAKNSCGQSAGSLWDFYTTTPTWTQIPGNLESLVAGDFNNDGTDDLAGLNASGGVYYTTNLSTWTNIPGLTFSSLAVGDFNNNGTDDLAGLTGGGAIYYTTNLSTWTNIPGTLASLVAGDSNGDGTDDLAGLTGGGAIYYTTNLSTWTRIAGTLESLAVGDFNNNGTDDLVGLTATGSVYYTTNLSTWTRIPGTLASLAVGDFNNSGTDDIAGLNALGSVYYTTNLSTWTRIPGTLASLAVGDFINTGADDLAGLNAVGSVYYTTNLSTWTRIPGTLASIAVGDFNNDGTDDLAGLNAGGAIFYIIM